MLKGRLPTIIFMSLEFTWVVSVCVYVFCIVTMTKLV